MGTRVSDNNGNMLIGPHLPTYRIWRMLQPTSLYPCGSPSMHIVLTAGKSSTDRLVGAVGKEGAAPRFSSMERELEKDVRLIRRLGSCERERT